MSDLLTEELLTIQEVADLLRVDPTTARRWVKSGALEAVTLPTRGLRHAYRIRRTSIEALFQGNQSNQG